MLRDLGDWELLRGELAAAIADDDPTALLLADHHWLRSVVVALKTRVLPSDDVARTSLQDVLAELRRLIEVHIRKEEDVYFPALEPLLVEAGQGATVDMYGEHDAIRIRHDQLIDAVTARDDAVKAFRSFEHSLLVHFDNEEDLIFEEAPRRLSADESRALVAAMQHLEEDEALE